MVECIQELQRVEKTLQNLIDKYTKQIREQKRLARVKMYNKSDAMHHIRTMGIIKIHKKNLHARLTNCISKRYQLESLNVTKMHIEAVKLTSLTFNRFLQQNDVDKVARLQDTLADMIEDACEINQVLEQPLGTDSIDEAELEQEYELICEEIKVPTMLENMPEAPSNQINTSFGYENMEMVPLTG